METTFTNVFYEPTQDAAQARLKRLREIDKYPEIKAYIIQEGENSWRVLRKIHENFTEKLQIMLAFSRGVGYII